MGLFNFAKALEQGLYDVMMWIFFYPYTLLRMLIFPSSTMRYVREESSRDPNVAFASAMQPAIFMFISIAIGAMVAPLNAGQLAQIEQSEMGQIVAGSWFALLLWRMVTFSFFALVGAALADLLTPGRITRETMRGPFHQQCYICSPLALIASPSLVEMASGIGSMTLVPFAAIAIWFVVCQFLFFRQFAGKPILTAAGLAIAVPIIGTVGIVASDLLLL